MLAKRIIPCLDIKNGRTVKGINFENIRDAGDPVELAAFYASKGADELVFLDITATNEERNIFTDLVKNIAAYINIPFTVGGGIHSIETAHILLQNGADKVSINSAAFKKPKLIQNLAYEFGSQCVVLAIDTQRNSDGDWYVYLNGGRFFTGVKAMDWAQKAIKLGAGEILLTSMNNDGTKSGFDLDILSTFSRELSVPIIASGGAGKKEDFAEVFLKANVDAALAASVFHFREIDIPDLKNYLDQQNITIRR